MSNGYEGRFDRTQELQPLLQKLYELRQQAEAEEWPVAPEPILDDLTGAAQPTPTAAPAGQGISLHLHELALVGISILATAWIVVRSIALSISQ